MPMRSVRSALLSSVILIVVPHLAAAQEDEVLLLAPILVEGSDGVATEGTGSYSTERATVGGRQPVDIRDVPQSVTVITSERLKDANAHSLEEAAYTIPNLNTALGDVYTGSLYSRGSEVFTYNIDGAPRNFLSLYGTAPDLVFFDRIEVLSGPSGVYQGTGEPVGTLNLVRKRPLSFPQGTVSASGGSFNAKRAEFDYSTPLNESGTVRGRIIAYTDRKDSFVDYVNNNRDGIYGTVEVDLSDRTTLSFGVIAESQQALRFSGLPTYTDGTLLDVPRETYIGADWNSFDRDSNEIFAEVEHEFDYGGILKFSSRRYNSDVKIRSVLPTTAVDLVTGDFDLMVFARDYEEQADFLDLNLTSPFKALGTSGVVTVGADYRGTNQIMKQNFDFSPGTHNINTFDPTSITEPTITFPGVGPGFRLNTETDTTEYGLYAQGRVDLGLATKLSAGLRYVSYDSKAVDTGRNSVRSDIQEQRFVGNIGLTYDINDRLTAYGGYSDIFQPQVEQRADGSQLNPVVGQQFEIGLKGSFNGGRLTTQVAAFLIESSNRAVDDPLNPGSFVDSGEATSKGFEAMLQGEISPNWMISGGYTYVDTDLPDNPVSPHSLTLWGKYTVPETQKLAGLELGLGVRAASSFSAVSDGVTISAPGYGVVDAMVSYPIAENVSAQLSVENLADRKYYTRVNHTTRGGFYGTPRRLTFTVAASF